MGRQEEENAAREETLVQRGMLWFMTAFPMLMIAMAIATGSKEGLSQGQGKWINISNKAVQAELQNVSVIYYQLWIMV